MNNSINKIWNKISRIGLREGEDAFHFREVILLNRLMAVMFVVMMCYIPVEIWFNGFQMLPAVLIMTSLMLILHVFNYFRLFRLGQYYLYTISILFVVVMGILVGKEVYNRIVFLPITLLGIIVVKTRIEKVGAFVVAMIAYIIQLKLFEVIPPQVYIPLETKEIFAIIFFVLGLLFTAMIGFYFLGINKEYENIIVMQKESMELKNKEITDSITYAKRIQTAILPSDDIVRKHLKDSFVLYLPKDVVAGDFYWLEHIKDIVLFAAADCTGHGVPGAMMSVVCHNALNRSVREEGLTDPGKILDRTREIIIAELGKSNEAVKDGMDISFCTLNFKTLELKWAGANNPLWIIRNGELLETKPDKQPIGQHLSSTPFNSHVMQLQENDVLYVFTDGYQDQFGGEKGKKFKASHLKELLLSIQSKSLEEQKKMITETFMNWKGLNEQVDDVCMIGVRL